MIGFLCGSLYLKNIPLRKNLQVSLDYPTVYGFYKKEELTDSVSPSVVSTLEHVWGSLEGFVGTNCWLPSSSPISQVSDSAGLCLDLIACPSAKFLNEPNASDSELSEPLTHKLNSKSLKALPCVC